MYFAQQNICDSSHLRPPKLDPWHQPQLSVGNLSPRATDVNWVTDRTNLARPQLQLDDERQDAGHAGRPGWHAYPAMRVTDRRLKRALSAGARYLEGGRRARRFDEAAV